MSLFRVETMTSDGLPAEVRRYCPALVTHWPLRKRRKLNLEPDGWLLPVSTYSNYDEQVGQWNTLKQ